LLIRRDRHIRVVVASRCCRVPATTRCGSRGHPRHWVRSVRSTTGPDWPAETRASPGHRRPHLDRGSSRARRPRRPRDGRPARSKTAGKFRSYCLKGDPICNLSVLNLGGCKTSPDTCAHIHYPLTSLTYTTLAGNFLINRWRTLGPQPPPVGPKNRILIFGVTTASACCARRGCPWRRSRSLRCAGRWAGRRGCGRLGALGRPV